MDDSGLPWAFLDQAIRPDRMHPGTRVIVGSGQVRAVAVKGSVTSNAQLLAEETA